MSKEEFFDRKAEIKTRVEMTASQPFKKLFGICKVASDSLKMVDELSRLHDRNIEKLPKTLVTVVKKLVESGILQETTTASGNKVFAYEEYPGIIGKDTQNFNMSVWH